MRILIFSFLFILTSCATHSGVPDLESRLVSWTGASVFDLAKELGEPTSISDDWWEWQFKRPGKPAATIDSSLARTIHTGTTGTSIQRKECVYSAWIDGASIVQIETFAVSGSCRFNEIPLREQH